MFALPGMKIAILSNMGEELLAYMRQNFAWLDGFHHLTWSCELNLIKPLAAIYEHTLEKLNVRADEALFIDDRLENVEGARAVGIHSLVIPWRSPPARGFAARRSRQPTPAPRRKANFTSDFQLFCSVPTPIKTAATAQAAMVCP